MSKMLKGQKLASLTVLFLILISSSSFAATRFSVIGSRPVADGGKLFKVLESKTLSQWQWSAGTAFNFEHLPLNTNVGTRIVERMFYEHVYGAVGFTDWFDASLDMPVVWYNRFFNPDTGAAASNRLGQGDLSLTARFRLLNRDKFHFGIAVAPFVTFPTGRKSLFIGDDGFTGGGNMIFDGDIGNHLIWGLNVGGLVRKKIVGYGLNFSSQFLLSAGLNVKITDLFAIVGELETRTPFTNFFKDVNSTPAESRVGFQWTMGRDRNIIMSAGASFGITYGAGSAKYGAFASITYKGRPIKIKSRSARGSPKPLVEEKIEKKPNQEPKS